MGYCHLRDAIRVFSLSRIIKAKKTGKSFQVPDDFDFQKRQAVISVFIGVMAKSR